MKLALGCLQWIRAPLMIGASAWPKPASFSLTLAV
jgi:hypothetical protein